MVPIPASAQIALPEEIAEELGQSMNEWTGVSQKNTSQLIYGTLLACGISTAVIGCGGFGDSDGPLTEFQTETVAMTLPGEWKVEGLWKMSMSRSTGWPVLRHRMPICLSPFEFFRSSIGRRMRMPVGVFSGHR